MEQWSGKVAVVTGASSGIGYSTAKSLANHGIIVVAIARRLNKLQELATEKLSGPGRIIPICGDVTNEEQIGQLFQKIENEVGNIRILINNAGVSPKDDLMDFELDKWKTMFNVNLFGLANCTKHVVNSAKKNKPGLVHIVNINSISGHKVPERSERFVYSMTKHCVTMLTKQLIKYTASDEIRFSSVSPGLVKTEILDAGGWDMTFDDMQRPYLNAESIADGIITVLSAPSNVVISEITIKPQGEIF